MPATKWLGVRHAARRADLFRRWQILPARVRAPHARFVFGGGGFFLRGEEFRAYVVPTVRDERKRESSSADGAHGGVSSRGLLARMSDVAKHERKLCFEILFASVAA